MSELHRHGGKVDLPKLRCSARFPFFIQACAVRSTSLRCHVFATDSPCSHLLLVKNGPVALWCIQIELLEMRLWDFGEDSERLVLSDGTPRFAKPNNNKQLMPCFPAATPRATSPMKRADVKRNEAE